MKDKSLYDQFYEDTSLDINKVGFIVVDTWNRRKKQKQQKIEVVETKNVETMYTIKIVVKGNSGKREFVSLLSSENVNYHRVYFDSKTEFEEQKVNILGKDVPYHYYGGDPQGEEGSFIALCLFGPGEPEWSMVRKAIVYIMQEGKTIDKLEVN